MELVSITCVRHQALNSMYCKVCKEYLCPECITDHGTELHKPEYMHITQYAPAYVLPKVQKLIEAIPEETKDTDKEIEELKEGLEELLPELNEIVKFHETGLKYLKQIATTLGCSPHQRKKEKYSDNIKKGLDLDKALLEKMIKGKNIKGTLKIVQKIDEVAELYKKKTPIINLLTEFQKDIEILKKRDILKNISNITGIIGTKYRLLKATRYNKDWKCDRKYLTTKMTLSEDGLVYGNSTSSGYPAIIGDVSFNDGLYAFEVIPEGLDCTGKEGFGIIEHDLYLSAFETDPVTPTVHDKMIGFLYKRQAQNMTAVNITDMALGAKYYVKVNMVELTMEITGPGVLLTTKLKPDTSYVPCFSCGCTSNKLRIRPLDEYEEGDSLIKS